MSLKSTGSNKDAEHLASLGYKQELNRSLSFFSNFAIAFAFISATTGIFTLFGYGLTTGGPAFIWSWPIVFIGQLLVGLSMGEVASHYPIAGSIYQWGKHLVNRTYAWFSGWIYLIALLATMTAVDYGGAPFVAQLFGWDAPSQMLLIVITVVMVLLQTFINAYGVKLTAIINNIGVVAEILVMIVLSVTLLSVGTHHSFAFTFDTGGTAGASGYLPAFLAAMLTSTWVMYGFDSAGGLAEEVKDARRVVPKAIISAIVLTFIVGGLALLAFVLAIPDLDTAMKSNSALSYIFESNLGAGVANAFIVVAVLAIFICGIAVQATASRLMYSFGRDNKIPGSKLWVKVSKKTETPVAAIVFTGIFTVVLSISASAEAYIVNIAVVGIYLAYISVPIGSLIARRKGWDPKTSPWNLGKWGLPVNILAAIWGAFVIINMSWPRSPDSVWYKNYSLPLLVFATILLGALYYFTMIHSNEVQQEKKMNL